MNEVHKRFFDRWLKGIENGQDADRKVRIFTMGRNQWRYEDEWPPAGTRTVEFYLHSGGRANTLAGDGGLSREAPSGEEQPDTYVYNPENPVLSVPDFDKFPSPDYPLDNRWRLRRDDVLVYTSAPLDEEFEITGHPFFRLYASSDCPDTDWHVTLSEVLPDGRSEELSWGCMRAAYRAGTRVPPSAIEPGKVYEYTIEMPATSNLFRKGNRVRVAIASSHFPMATINPNTNAPTGSDDDVRIATNSVHHSKIHASCLLAPVAPPPAPAQDESQ
jgi:putative CocE/NonD family hydrolase